MPNWNFRGVFSVNKFFLRKDQRSCDGRGALYFFRVPCSSYRVRHSSVGFSVDQKGAAKLRRAALIGCSVAQKGGNVAQKDEA